MDSKANRPLPIDTTAEAVAKATESATTTPPDNAGKTVSVRRCAVCGDIPTIDNVKESKKFRGQVVEHTRIRVQCVKRCPGQTVTKNSINAAVGDWNFSQIKKLEARVARSKKATVFPL